MPVSDGTLSAVGAVELENLRPEDVFLDVPRFEQLDDETCGPACLKAVYHHYGLDLPLQDIVTQVRPIEGGGTICPNLGLHALRQGFAATLYPFSLRVFDPTWYGLGRAALLDKLDERRERCRNRRKMPVVVDAYREFLAEGGRLEFHDLDAGLIHRLVAAGTPVLTGLCATYLYQVARVSGPRDDDVGGAPEGHFLVICGSLPSRDRFVVRDPSRHIPFSQDGRYSIPSARLIQAILTGDSTYDAAFLTIRPEGS